MVLHGRIARKVSLLTTSALAVSALALGLGSTALFAAEVAPPESLRLMAPASPGGGWDQTTRFAQSVLQQDGIIPGTVEVYNVPGAGGTIGLAQMVATERGSGDFLMTMGLVMVGSILTNDAAVTLDQTTPIARLTAEYEVIAVPANSEFQTLDDLVEAFKADPGSISWAGGSAGGVDHILVGLLAKEVGVDATQINYIPFSGGGEALAAMLGGHVSAGVTGYGEWAGQIESGDLRALAVSSGERIEGVDVPTILEQGIDIEVANWRGMVAPPGITGEERAALVSALDQMHASDRWQEILTNYKWNDFYLSGDAFDAYLDSESKRVEGVLKEIGLVD